MVSYSPVRARVGPTEMVDRYTHFVDEMRKEAAEKIDAILNPVAVNEAVNKAN